jgi:hypothetical protein
MFKTFLIKKRIKLIKSKIQDLISIGDGIHERVNLNLANELWNDKRLKIWLRTHGIEATTLPPHSMGGSGIAYFLPNNMVVKVTDDIVEANIAKMLISSIIDHTFIDVLNIQNYYLILQHKLDTKNTPEDLKRAADLVTVMIDDNSLESFPNDEALIKKMCIETIKENNFPISFLDKMLLIIKMLKELQDHTGFFHDDAGPTNIGTKDGKTYVFDLGPNKTKTYSPESAIEKINSRREELGLKKHNFS